MASVGATEFQGTARFEILRRVGAGGMGVVYEALDRERNCRVALKTVRDLGGEDLLRLKNEFRALQDLSHPNLVSLGELLEDGGRWFFTMELIDGTSFLNYVRRGSGPAPDTDAPAAAGGQTAEDVSPSAATWQLSPARQVWEAALATAPRFNEPRLRSAFAQLAQALAAVHAVGKVHRDIKPSNVLVTREGRVVLLDFGLVTGVVASDQSTAGHAVGTIAYMAPEQAASQRVGPAADWYSAGVLLYEALTGQVPFVGAPLEVMLKKQQHDPPRPSTLCASVPRDLDALAASLLHFDPRARPGAGDVLLRLGLAQTTESHAAVSGGSLTQAPPFVGRGPELAALTQAFATSREGQAVAVLVGGESGVGKSALVRQFTEPLAGRGVVVLAGRCYERETVPFKAVDGVVDALSRYMARLPDDEAAMLLPRSASLLGEVFPVLRRVKVMAKAPRSSAAQQVDPQELRSRLFAAMRELIGRLADRSPLVMVIDDLQWGDADSLALLGEVLRPPEAPAFLAVATVRLGMTGVLPDISRHMPPDVRRVTVGRLPAAEARELASRLLERFAPATPTAAESIAVEADGHPLFIDELVRHLGMRGEVTAGALRLDDALRLRVSGLEDGARRILELTAVAGRPLSHDVVRRAASLEPEPYARQIGVLRVSNFVHSSGARASDTVSPYHDRVRESVVARLPDDQRRALHEQLAVALEQSAHVDPELLAVHWREAGERERAAAYAEKAAEVAAGALAFDHAASMYRTALDLRPPTYSRATELRIRLGAVLAQAGRCREAGEEFIAAAADAPPAQALDLQRRAGDQYVRAGCFDEGLKTVRGVLRAMGMRLPNTPRQALTWLLLRRLWLRLRGLRWRQRHADQIPAEELARLDFCNSLANPLAQIDNILGIELNAHTLQLALRAGNSRRLLPALATEAIFLSLSGGAPSARLRRLQRSCAESKRSGVGRHAANA